MNQEQNNSNQNNLNTQNNNGISNNQSYNQDVSGNREVINSQPQQPLNYEQTIMQQSTPQSIDNEFETRSANNQSFNSKPTKKINLGLIIGIIIVIIAVITIILILLNGNRKNDLVNNLNISLEKNSLVCNDEKICNQLNNSIISIKNIENKYNNERLNAIILDKDGYVYLKSKNNIIKIEGKTKLTDINYVVEVAYASNDLIVYDDSNMYYISSENNSIRNFELSNNIKYFVNFSEDSKLSAIDKNGTGLIYYRCDRYNNNSCTSNDDWFYEESLLVKNAKYSGGESILIGDKLYSKSIIVNQELVQSSGGIETQLILNNVAKVWAWDNLKNNINLMALTKDSKLFFIKAGALMSHKSYELNLNEKVNDIYFIDGESYGSAVVVGKNNVYLVSYDYDDNYDTYYKLDKIGAISSYIDNIKGFYCEDNKLYTLLNDGNIYLVEDFLKD